MSPPWLDSSVVEHLQLVLTSYRCLVGRALLPDASPRMQAERIWQANFVLLSHDASQDPRFTYGNRRALQLWDLDWENFIGLPSQQSAQASERAQREVFLQAVRQHGWASGYSGIRADRQGRRFRIEDVTLWNLIDADQVYRGQAATYETCTWLDQQPLTPPGPEAAAPP